MLISLKLNNCFVFADEVEFSMRADMRYRRFSSNVSVFDSINILKSALIIGPNNSGKTNFIRSIHAIRQVLLNKSSPLSNNMFSNNPLCEIELTFLQDRIEYEFALKYDVNKEEYLYERFSKISYDKYKNRKCQDIIIRDSIGRNYYCEDETLILAMKIATKNNILVHLLDAEQFPVLKEIKYILTSFAEKIDVIDMNNIPMKKTVEMLKKSNVEQQKISDFIRNADLALEDYRYLNDEELKISMEVIGENNNQPQEKVLRSTNDRLDMLHLTSFYKGIPVPSYIFDSTGTKKIAALASYVIDALENDRILIIDELDNSLHFRLTRAIIALFNNELNNHAQLICSVHDTSLLDCQKLFRKEQIWFTHKDDEGTYLYSLSEFTNEKDKVRDTSDLIQKYKSGIFGAIPDPDLFSSMESIVGVREHG